MPGTGRVRSGRVCEGAIAGSFSARGRSRRRPSPRRPSGLPALGPALKSQLRAHARRDGRRARGDRDRDAVHAPAVGARRRPHRRALGDRDGTHGSCGRARRRLDDAQLRRRDGRARRHRGARRERQRRERPRDHGVVPGLGARPRARDPADRDPDRRRRSEPRSCPSSPRPAARTLAFLFLAGSCATGAVVAAVFVRGGASREPELEDISRPLRDSRMWLLGLGTGFYLVAQIGIISFVVLFLHDERHVSTAGVDRPRGDQRARDRRSDRLGTRSPTGSAAGSDRCERSAWRSRSAPPPPPPRPRRHSRCSSRSSSIAGVLSMSWNGLAYAAAAEAAGTSQDRRGARLPADAARRRRRRARRRSSRRSRRTAGAPRSSSPPPARRSACSSSRGSANAREHAERRRPGGQLSELRIEAAELVLAVPERRLHARTGTSGAARAAPAPRRTPRGSARPDAAGRRRSPPRRPSADSPCTCARAARTRRRTGTNAPRHAAG